MTIIDTIASYYKYLQNLMTTINGFYTLCFVASYFSEHFNTAYLKNKYTIVIGVAHSIVSARKNSKQQPITKLTYLQIANVIFY